MTGSAAVSQKLLRSTTPLKDLRQYFRENVTRAPRTWAENPGLSDGTLLHTEGRRRLALPAGRPLARIVIARFDDAFDAAAEAHPEQAAKGGVRVPLVDEEGHFVGTIEMGGQRDSDVLELALVDCPRGATLRQAESGMIELKRTDSSPGEVPSYLERWELGGRGNFVFAQLPPGVWSSSPIHQRNHFETTYPSTAEEILQVDPSKLPRGVRYWDGEPSAPEARTGSAVAA